MSNENENPMKYQAMVMNLAKDSKQILAEMTPLKCYLDHMAMGIAGEAGEVLDVVKKHTKYNKLLDRKKVVEELGDLEFYLEGLRQSLGISREEILNANMDKLLTGKNARYKEGTFSNEAAIARRDKQPQIPA